MRSAKNFKKCRFIPRSISVFYLIGFLTLRDGEITFAVTFWPADTAMMSDFAPERVPWSTSGAVCPLSDKQGALEKVERTTSAASRSKIMTRTLTISLATWSILLVIMTAVIVGGAVGGGLGAKLAECQSQLSE